MYIALQIHKKMLKKNKERCHRSTFNLSDARLTWANSRYDLSAMLVQQTPSIVKPYLDQQHVVSITIPSISFTIETIPYHTMVKPYLVQQVGLHHTVIPTSKVIITFPF